MTSDPLVFTYLIKSFFIHADLAAQRLGFVWLRRCACRKQLAIARHFKLTICLHSVHRIHAAAHWPVPATHTHSQNNDFVGNAVRFSLSFFFRYYIAFAVVATAAAYTREESQRLNQMNSERRTVNT